MEKKTPAAGIRGAI